MTYSPNKDLNLRLLYSRSLIRPYNGFIGGTVGEPLPYGYADDGFGGRLNDAPADTFAVQFLGMSTGCQKLKTLDGKSISEVNQVTIIINLNNQPIESELPANHTKFLTYAVNVLPLQ